MSLVRTALRLAAVAALNADPVIGGLCPGRVYDSRIDDLDSKDPVPVIVVFTEDDKGHAWSVNNGGPPFDHACDLLFEISMRVVVPVDETDAVQIGLPETDPEAEIALDLLEERAIEAVTNADTPQARLIRQKILRRAVEFKSIRYASSDSGSKLALRMVSLTTHLKIDQPDARDVPCGPFASLPEPLRSVAASLKVGSAAANSCLAIAQLLNPTVVTPVPLTGIDLTVQPQQLQKSRTPALADPTAAMPVTQRIDLQTKSDPCP